MQWIKLNWIYLFEAGINTQIHLVFCHSTLAERTHEDLVKLSSHAFWQLLWRFQLFLMSSNHIRHSEFPEHMLLVIDTSYKFDFCKVYAKLNSFLGKFLLEACHLTKNKLLQKLFSRILYKFQPICCKFLIYLTVSICWNTLWLLLFLLLTQTISTVLIVRNYFFKKLVLMIWHMPIRSLAALPMFFCRF